MVAVMTAGAYALKAVGVTVLGGFVERRLQALVSLLPAALFTAMVVLMTFGRDSGLAVDARLAGVAAGAVAVWRRASLIVVVVVAMAATAGLRLLVR